MKADKAHARRLAAMHRDTIAALAMSMPPALAVRFNSLNHCMEASVVGARILRAASVPARVIPCAVLTICEATIGVAAGYSSSELTAMHPPGTMVFNEATDDSSFHVVIEAQPVTGRTIIDLTAGQLLDNAQTLVMPDEEWPCGEINGWRIKYDTAPRAAIVEEWITLADAMEYNGLQGDVMELMSLAKHCRCDKELFYRALLEHSPELTAQFLQVAERRKHQRQVAQAAQQEV